MRPDARRRLMRCRRFAVGRALLARAVNPPRSPLEGDEAPATAALEEKPDGLAAAAVGSGRCRATRLTGNRAGGDQLGNRRRRDRDRHAGRPGVAWQQETTGQDASFFGASGRWRHRRRRVRSARWCLADHGIHATVTMAAHVQHLPASLWFKIGAKHKQNCTLVSLRLCISMRDRLSDGQLLTLRVPVDLVDPATGGRSHVLMPRRRTLPPSGGTPCLRRPMARVSPQERGRMPFRSRRCWVIAP